MNCDIENIVFFGGREGKGAAEFQESCLYSLTLNGVCVSHPRLLATNFTESTV